ncbi:hypothetical protein ACQKTA_13390 (plasmid) [Enterococcus sp. 22-H-5-01]|uniref:hypothetical protein n=1 Tax=Enterococcus sp. 22-H-5-01 TaxID=3418555 RepID=UPI003CFCBEF3
MEKVYPEQLADTKVKLEKTIQDNEWASVELQKDFSMTLLDHIYTDKKEALEAFNSLVATDFGQQAKTVGSYYGFSLKVQPAHLGQTLVILERERPYTVAVEKNGNGSLIRLSNVLRALPETVNDLKNKQSDLEEKITQAEEQLEKPFEQEEELNTLLEKQTALNLSLEMGETKRKVASKEKRPTVQITEAPAVGQSQAASYEQAR